MENKEIDEPSTSTCRAKKEGEVAWKAIPHVRDKNCNFMLPVFADEGLWDSVDSILFILNKKLILMLIMILMKKNRTVLIIRQLGFVDRRSVAPAQQMPADSPDSNYHKKQNTKWNQLEGEGASFGMAAGASHLLQIGMYLFKFRQARLYMQKILGS